MLSHPRFLILEDDEDDYILVKEVIEENLGVVDCEITWRESGEGLEDLLTQQAFDVALIDYRLGKEDGFEVGKRIRDLHPSVSIIMLTGIANADLNKLDIHARDIGAADFLSKRDLEPRILAKSIRYALERTRQLRDSREKTARLEEVLQSNGLVLWSENLGEEGALFYSRSVKQVTGYSRKDLEPGNISWLDRVHKDFRNEAACLRQKAIDHGESRGVYWFQKKDGEWIWLTEHVSCVEHPVRKNGYCLNGRIQDCTLEHAHDERIRLLANSLEQSSEGVLITDNELDLPGPRILFANKAMSQISGYSSEELIGNTPRIFQGPKTDPEITEELKRRCKEGREFTATTVNYRKDGAEYYVNWRIRPLRDDNGKITHFISTQRDITEEYEQKIELERSEQFLREIGSMALIGGWRYDKATHTLSWSEQTRKIHGLEQNVEVSLEKAMSFYPGRQREKIESVFNDCIEKGIPYDVILRLKTAEEKLLWTRTKGEPVCEGDAIVGAWGVFQDITDVYKMKMKSEIFYELAVELSCIASKKGYFLEMNQRWEDLLGWTIQEMQERPINEFVHPDDIEKTIEATRETFEKGSLASFENRYQHKDGHYVHLLWHAQLAGDGQTVFALARDISDRKSREVQLEEALRKAEVASTAKNQFLMVMSHELRTPLNPIMATADLLLEGENNSDNRVMLQLIKDSSIHLTSLIADILDISSIEAGRITLDEKPFSVIEAVHSCVDILRARAAAKALRLKVEENFPEGQKALVCLGDKRKFRQILLNLLGNAVKFTERGTIFVKCAYEMAPGEDVAHFTIVVEDSGIGIPEDELERVFDRFHQVSMTKSRAFQGQGLGLSLSRELAGAMGGDITVDSALGKGSTFKLTLPFEVVDREDQKEVAVAEESAQAESRPKHLVLIVEDDPVNQIVLQRLLKRLGASYVLARNGREGVDAAAEQAFDFILMDIQMPVLDGIEATREIRAGNGPNRETSIIAVTAHAVSSVKEACFGAGMNDFMEKPVSLNGLREKLGSLA